MNGQAITILSGIVLLLVFALVGRNLKRKRTRDEQGRSNKIVGHDR